MNDIWELLGIEPTDDKKIIRRAYAEQSRLHHPEEEPEYFTALNQAYKAALDHGIRLKNTENMSDSEKGSTEIRETQKIQKEQEISKTQEIQITQETQIIQETQTIQKTSKKQDNQAIQAIQAITKTVVLIKKSCGMMKTKMKKTAHLPVILRMRKHTARSLP